MPLLEPNIRNIVIVGGGTAGWMTAAAFASVMGKTHKVTLIESSSIGTVGVGEATIPPLISMNRNLGIKEADFMRRTSATFKLGIAFENWKTTNDRYIHSFGITGTDHWSAGFHHFWLRALRKNPSLEYGDFCLEVEAAEKQKFAHVAKHSLNYAYHIDSTAYAALLRERAEEGGVVRIDDKVVNVRLVPDTGEIQSLDLASGNCISGDFFIDCSGFRALLIEQALHAGYDDWGHLLPCDRAIAVQTHKADAPNLPYTRAIAHQSGWQWRIPLQHRGGNGIVYSSAFMSDDAAEDLLTSTLNGPQRTDLNRIKFRTGMRRKHWLKNCVAIGLSDGFIEPLESTSIHLMQRAIIRLLQLFPKERLSDSEAREYNQQTDEEYAYIRDFIILHYCATEREDSGFWRFCKNMEIPQTLQHRIDLFRSTGRVFRRPDELFAENSWVQVMLGQGILPQTYHPLADVMDPHELDSFLDKIGSRVRGVVSELPSHDQYVRTYCGSSAL